MSKQFKEFEFKNKEDYTFVLFDLIAGVIASLDKYKRYNLELEAKVQPYLLADGKNDSISAEVYDSLNHKLHDVSSDLIKIIADMQNSSMSYRMFRKIAEKRGSLISLPPLAEDIKKEISELLDVRNWSFHNPQSLLTAHREIFEKSVPDELKQYINWDATYNPIKVIIPDNYEISYLISLYLHTSKRIEIFSHILNSMLCDYSALIGKKARYEIIHDKHPKDFFDFTLKQAQLSMAIQKGKYRGDDKDFNKITFANEKAECSK